MQLINTRIIENKMHTCLRYFYLAKSFKFQCYNSLDNSGSTLWKRVIKMGWILIENSKIEKLDRYYNFPALSLKFY